MVTECLNLEMGAHVLLSPPPASSKKIRYDIFQIVSIQMSRLIKKKWVEIRIDIPVTVPVTFNSTYSFTFPPKLKSVLQNYLSITHP